METHSHCFLLQGFSPVQNKRIQLRDKKGSYAPYLFDLLYIKADRQYTWFYVMETPRSGKCNKIVMSRNMGQYCWLKQFEFGQADDGLLFNINYLYYLTTAYEVKLLHAHENGPIFVLPAHRAALNAQLKSIGWINASQPAAAQKALQLSLLL